MKSRMLVLTSVFALALLLLGPAVPAAQAADIPVTLGPGQEATIPLRLWCLDYGKPFPAALGAPGSRAPDGVVAVVQAGIAKGTVISNLYQTQLAIWRVTTGTFNDYAGQGSAVAQQIYNDSLAITVPPIPAGTVTLAQAIADGKVTYQITNFKPVTATLPPVAAASTPFFGTAEVKVKNVSQGVVKFTLVEGTVFPPLGGQNAQNLVSHLDTTEPLILPETGAASAGVLPWLGLAAGLLVAGWALRRPQRR